MNTDSTPQPAGAAILVVDDDDATLDVLGRLLSRSGYTPLLAAGPAQCRDILEHTRPALILLDLFMPDKDGFSLLQEIKRTPSLQHVPVIIHTLIDSCEYQEKARALGAAAYLPKPLDLRDVLAHIARLLLPAAQRLTPM